jgi:hypothetical protein
VILSEQSGRGLSKPEVFVSVDDPAMEPMLGAAAQRQADMVGKTVGVWSCSLANCWSPNNLETRSASHYRFVLDKVFSGYNASFVIILGEERIPSPDFLLFFQAAQEVLLADGSLWCASAWNDGSLLRFARDPQRISRTASFPGQAWMIGNATWRQLRPSWPSSPSSSWEEWLSGQLLDTMHECLQPEVSRISRSSPGSSDYFSTEEGNNFGSVDYVHQDHYEKRVASLVANATRLDFHDVVKGRYGALPEAPPTVHLVPFLAQDWPQFAEPAGLRTDRVPGSLGSFYGHAISM